MEKKNLKWKSYLLFFVLKIWMWFQHRSVRVCFVGRSILIPCWALWVYFKASFLMTVSKHTVRCSGLLLSFLDYCDMLHLFLLIRTPTARHPRLFCSTSTAFCCQFIVWSTFSSFILYAIVDVSVYGLSCIWISAPVSWKFLSPKWKTKVFVESFRFLITENPSRGILAVKTHRLRIPIIDESRKKRGRKNKTRYCSCIKTGVRTKISTNYCSLPQLY